MSDELTNELKQENEKEKSAIQAANIREILLAPFLPYRTGRGPKSRELTEQGFFGESPSSDRIRNAYGELTHHLSTRFQANKTKAECLVSKQMKRAVRYEALRSYWIGPFCLDFFFPQIATQPHHRAGKFHGLVLEIDGSIHNHEFKMRKDEVKIREFSQRGICFASVPNEKLREFDLNRLFQELRGFYCSDHRKKQRLLTKLHTWTLLAWASSEALETLFGLKRGDLDKLREALNSKHLSNLDSSYV